MMIAFVINVKYFFKGDKMSEVRIVDRRSFSDTAWTQVNDKYNSAEYYYMNLIDDLLCAMNRWIEKADKKECIVNKNNLIDSAFKRAKDILNKKRSTQLC